MPSEKSHKDILNSVKSWIEHVIIGLNFCPFAKKEVMRDSIRYAISEHATNKDALDDMLNELSMLDKQDDVQTTLIIFCNGFANFEQYLDLVDAANHLIEQGGYAGIYQLATFHPDYCFTGEEHSDAANYTNRSPYPILHLLRESSLDAVLKHYPNPEDIPTNNIAKARRLGAAFFKQQLAQ